MALVFAHASLFGHTFLIHTLIGGSLLVVVGTQLVGFGLCGRSYAVYQLGDQDPWFERIGRRVRLEHGLLLGLGLDGRRACARRPSSSATGSRSGLGSLAEERVTILAATLAHRRRPGLLHLVPALADRVCAAAGATPDRSASAAQSRRECRTVPPAVRRARGCRPDPAPSTRPETCHRRRNDRVARRRLRCRQSTCCSPKSAPKAACTCSRRGRSMRSRTRSRLQRSRSALRGRRRG